MPGVPERQRSWRQGPHLEQNARPFRKLERLAGSSMHRVLILGAGKIGALISGLLAESEAYEVQLADVDGATAEAVTKAHGSPHLKGFALDASAGPALGRHLF